MRPLALHANQRAATCVLLRWEATVRRRSTQYMRTFFVPEYNVSAISTFTARLN
jgi:hypothetical protein